MAGPQLVVGLVDPLGFTSSSFVLLIFLPYGILTGNTAVCQNMETWPASLAPVDGCVTTM